MSLRVGCPRCSAPVAEIGDGGWSCPEHGAVVPLWHPEAASYDEFAAHLGHANGFPTYLPWPLGPGWTVTDFASVAAEGHEGRATMTCVSGTSALDGPVDVIVARPSRPSEATDAKSVTVQPGPSGHGRYVGKPLA